MLRGQRIGSGGTCEVHDWGDGLVIKLFKPGFEYLAPMEAARAQQPGDLTSVVVSVVEVGHV